MLATATVMVALFAGALGAGLEIGRRAQHPSAVPAAIHGSRDMHSRGTPLSPARNAAPPGGPRPTPARSVRAPRPAPSGAAPASTARRQGSPAGPRVPGPRRPRPDRRPPVPPPPAPSPAAGLPAGTSSPAPQAPAPRGAADEPAPGAVAPPPDPAPPAPSEIWIPVTPPDASPAGSPAPEQEPRFFVQAGSFDVSQDAAALALRLQSRGYAVTVEAGPPYRVRVGGYVDRPTAERLAGILRTQGFPATVVRQ